MARFQPGAHGRSSHSPDGADPVQVGAWYNIGGGGTFPDGTAVPSFENGWANTGTGVPARVRIVSGSPNILDTAGNIAMYVEKVLQIQGDITGGVDGTTAFTLTKHFWQEFDIPGHMHDDTGAYKPCRLFANGQFQPGTP